MSAPEPIIVGRGLVKDYGSFRAVRGVDFTIQSGECFSLLGPNGAGKTTVMRIIHCFMPPTSGTVTVFGMDVRERPSEIKARLGVSPQEDNLDPDLSVVENLFVYARYFGIGARAFRPRAEELLRFANLTEKRDVNIKQLSGGMKRRLLLARALVGDPELLILDEPTTGLDPHARRDIWESLRVLLARGVTVLLSTHYMEEAEELSDRVAIMDQGGIVTIDSPANLSALHGGNLEAVYLKLTGRPLEH
jgi:lipooligosaccharide transport system ATP-binding protein